VSKIIELSLNKNADNADDFFEIAEALINEGHAEASELVTKTVCKNANKHKNCDAR
ncbi:MAG: hypothetical protein GY829_04990, partial [Gammaproteobacteria bacterium]|nr:hypothetical protein [Gammaproteobacteria bacterium]